jgi:hypothetical protein
VFDRYQQNYQTLDRKFGVEDLYGGGDRDFNDIVFELKFNLAG